MVKGPCRDHGWMLVINVHFGKPQISHANKVELTYGHLCIMPLSRSLSMGAHSVDLCMYLNLMDIGHSRCSVG